MITLDLSQLITAEAKATQALATAKDSARARLHVEVDAVRRLMITPLLGQDMIYLAKQAEARDWIAAEDPQLADYPMLSAEVGITTPDADSLAQLWLNMAALMLAEGARMERLRLSVGNAIDAAETVEQVATAVEGLG